LDKEVQVAVKGHQRLAYDRP